VPVDLALMGVMAPSGSHELVLHYRSNWFLAGALISLCSWLAVIAWLYLAFGKRPGLHPCARSG
jgi:uncharacterized membrane protein YfhO